MQEKCVLLAEERKRNSLVFLVTLIDQNTFRVFIETSINSHEKEKCILEPQ